MSILGSVLAAVAATVLTATPAQAAYHYTHTPVSANALGVEFHLVIEYDGVSNHLRATGIVQATGSGRAGRINYVSLFANGTNVANYTGNEATHGYLARWAGPIVCRGDGDVYFYATMKYHVDGTSVTRYLDTRNTATVTC